MGPIRARAAIFEGLGDIDVGASSTSMHAEHDGEQGSLGKVAVAVAIVVVTVLAFPLHAVTVLHSVVVLVWTLVVEPEIEVESSTF